MTDVGSVIRTYILEKYLPGESPGNLPDDLPLQSSGILDSMAMLGLAQFVEQRFQIELDVSDTSIERFDCIADIAGTIARKHAAGQAVGDARS